MSKPVELKQRTISLKIVYSDLRLLLDTCFVGVSYWQKKLGQFLISKRFGFWTCLAFFSDKGSWLREYGGLLVFAAIGSV